MFAWLSANIGTIIICLVLCAVVAAIVAVMVKDKKKGKRSSCGGSCCHCPMSGACADKNRTGTAK